MSTSSRSDCPSLSRLWHDLSHIYSLLLLKTKDPAARNLLLSTAEKLNRYLFFCTLRYVYTPISLCFRVYYLINFVYICQCWFYALSALETQELRALIAIIEYLLCLLCYVLIQQFRRFVSFLNIQLLIPLQRVYVAV